LIKETSRPLPWRPCNNENRSKEDVRPVFWIHRHQSYIKRTESWDDFPNGRWGDSRSPAFGDLIDFHLGVASALSLEGKSPIWGDKLNSIADVIKVFVSYCERKIDELPWNDLPLSVESDSIREWLVKINTHGFLTINSQPRVNAAPSTDPIHGWGGADGWVYQKSYVEFFIDESRLKVLLNEIQQKQYRFLTYHAVNQQGDKEFRNTHGTNALTWGVFPDSEIKQPTVVDRESFLVWKDEAFALWNVWGRQYPEGSQSRGVIHSIKENWFLVNIVDNNYISESSGLATLFNALFALDSSQR